MYETNDRCKTRTRHKRPPKSHDQRVRTVLMAPFAALGRKRALAVQVVLQRFHRCGQKPRLKLAASVGLTAACVFISAVTGTGIAAAQDFPCAPYIGVGVPGTTQGKAHNPGATDDVSLLGPQTAAVMDALSNEFIGFRGVSVNYQAEGLGGPFGLDGAIAKIMYNASVYKISKDNGYSTAYQTVSKLASDCHSSKFILVGYSQGAHIAGDLAQAILHNHGPVSKDRLSAAVLLADPAYNGTSPRTNEFRYDGVPPSDPHFKPSRDVLIKDQNHWTISGALGTRDPFDKSDPIVSVCIYGDPVCDQSSIGLGGLNGQAAIEKSWMHSDLYTKVRYGQASNLATWAGEAAADVIGG
jgi:hypothetical protein